MGADVIQIYVDNITVIIIIIVVIVVVGRSAEHWMSSATRTFAAMVWFYFVYQDLDIVLDVSDDLFLGRVLF